jgi:2-polyprenyl-3-methyl-5-hydroxy-6-metoxy-1,4-benzoquinol methylase
MRSSFIAKQQSKQGAALTAAAARALDSLERALALRARSNYHRGLARHLTPAGLERQFAASHDPWHFATSRYERQRYAAMLALIGRVPHGRLLELGCAEGHFTRLLLGLGAEVTAIDLSALAVARARQRAPGATYHCLRIEELPPEPEPYDLIVCGEVLYYVDDLDAVLAEMPQRGHYLLTSTCFPSALRIDAALHRFQRLERRLLVRPLERKAASICLWRLRPYGESHPA